MADQGSSTRSSNNVNLQLLCACVSGAIVGAVAALSGVLDETG